MANSFQNSPIIADILSRLTSVESVQGALPTPTEYDTIADLRAETVYSNSDRAIVSVVVNDHIYIYVFNDSVTDSDNGETILTPDDITEPAAGRWVADVSLSIVGHTHDDKANRITEPQQGKFLESDENGDPVESEHGAEDFSLEGHEHENYLDETDKEELEQSVEDAVNAVANKMNKLTGLTSGHIGSIPFIREDGHLDPSTIKATNIPSSDEKAGIVGLTGTDPAAKVSQINAILALLSSDDTTLDELQEIVDYIKLNRDDLDALSVSSIIGLQALLDLKLEDAPGDDYSYLRHNGEWVKEGSVIQKETASRTIYVETTGDDETGDGTSVGTAFASIGRALEDIGYLEPGINIVIQLGLGSFTLSPKDAYYLCNKEGNGLIRLKGTLTTIYPNVNHTTSGTFITTINTIDGNSVTLTDNELNGMFIRNNINSSYYDSDYLYHPIARNIGNVLDIAGYYHTATVTGDVVELGTTIYIGASGGAYYSPSSSILNASQNHIDFRELNMYFSDYTFIGGARGISLRNVKTINGGGYECPVLELPDILHISGCIFSCKDRVFSGTIKNSVFTSAIGCYVSGSSKLKNILFFGNTIGIQTDTSNEGIIINFGLDEVSIKFLNVSRCFNAGVPVNLIKSELANWIFEGVSYFVRNLFGSWDGFRIFLDGVKVTGSPTKWDYNSSTNFYRNNINSLIYFKGLVYPDYEYNLEESLTNAAQNDIAVGNINSNRSIIIDYTIDRNTLFEEGQLRILYNGTTLQFLQPVDLKQDNNGGSGIGVMFDVDFDATNTDLVNLEITLDSGDDATLKYDVKRSML